MTDREKIVFTSSVLTRFMKGQTDDRLKKGLALRNQIKEQIEKGETPTGYRVDWLKNTAARIIETLHECAKEFNEAHLDDRASAHDLADALATAQNHLQKAIKKNGL